MESAQSQGFSDYLKSSTKQLFLGNYTDDVTLLGTAAQIGTGLLGVDVLGDIRDISADFKNWEWTWGHTGQTVLDAVGLIPVIGVVKYGDEVGTLLKGVNKAEDFKVEKIVKAGEEVRKVDVVKGINNNKYWTNTSEYNGAKVFQRNDIINPGLADKLGRTNVERMEQGLAPIGIDGKSVNLHHMVQTNESPIAEVTQTFHQRNSKVIHINPNTTPSGINRTQFNNWRSSYWMNRSNYFK